jgi:DNA-binding NarL/FixJ family response regulator
VYYFLYCSNNQNPFLSVQFFNINLLEMLTQHHVLILEDDSSVRQDLIDFLAKAGFDTTQASDAHSVISTLHQQAFSLFVLDITQPDQSGMEVFKQVRQEWPALPILVVTDGGTIPFEPDADQAGAFGSISKPLVEDDVIRIAQRAVANRSVSDDTETITALEPVVDEFHVLKSTPLSTETLVSIRVSKTKNGSDQASRLYCKKCTTKEQLSSSRMMWYEYPIMILTFRRPYRCTLCYRRYWRRQPSAKS